MDAPEAQRASLTMGTPDLGRPCIELGGLIDEGYSTALPLRARSAAVSAKGSPMTPE
jgi:hypothetical protein